MRTVSICALLILSAAALAQSSKAIDIIDLFKDDQMRVLAEQVAKGNAARIREVKQANSTERGALIGSQIKGEGKVHVITANPARGKRLSTVSVTIEVMDGKVARHVTTKAAPDESLPATLKKGDKIKFQGTLTAFTANTVTLGGATYKISKDQ